MGSGATTAWRSQWTADDPPTLGYHLARDRGDPWVPGPHDDVIQRDLGLAQLSAGALGARHFRSTASAEASHVQHHDLDFRLLVVLQGSMTVDTEAGAVTLGPGGVMYDPTLWGRRETISPGWEAVEITSPAPISSLGATTELPSAAGATGAVGFSEDQPTDWVVGAGPRQFFAYRNLDAAAMTAGRIHVHLLRAEGPAPAGGTGWHYHTMSQIFFVVEGTVDISVEGEGLIRMDVGDAMCIGAGLRHNVEGYSPDYKIIEVCIPADYETFATEPPD